jgi:hypothetical protein
MELEMHILLEYFTLPRLRNINVPETELRRTRYVDLFRETVCAADGTSFYAHGTQFGECSEEGIYTYCK